MNQPEQRNQLTVSIISSIRTVVPCMIALLVLNPAKTSATGFNDLPSAITITIGKNPPPPINLLYFKAARKDNQALLEWKTTEEENQAHIELQRSDAGGAWVTIAKFELSAQHHDKLYTYKDKLEEKGEYTYQLKMVSASGRVTYSPMRKVFSEGAGISALYPNPSSNYIVVENAEKPESLIITNMFAQRFNIPAEKEGPNTARFNVQHLPKGMYLLRSGQQVIRFQKE